jgi:hypothetical protein
MFVYFFVTMIQTHSFQRLDFPMEPQYKSRHVKALLKLSRASGLYPECFTLKNIEMENHPVDNGGYGDVYRGRLHGRKIAVKVLKVYQTSDLTRLVKVCLKCDLYQSRLNMILRNFCPRLSYGVNFPTPTFCLSTGFIVQTVINLSFV